MKFLSFIFSVFSLVYYCAQSIDLKQVSLPITKEKDFLIVVKFAKNILAKQRFDSNTAKETYPYITSALAFKSSKSKIVDVFYIKILLLGYYSQANNETEILKLCAEMRRDSKLLPKKEELILYGWLNGVYTRLELYDKLLEISPRLIELTKGSDAFRNKNYEIVFDYATAYFELKNYSQALKLFEQQAKIFKKAGNSLMSSSMINDIGLCYLEMHDYKNALKYFNSAIDELKIPNRDFHDARKVEYNAYFKDIILANIGEIELLNGNKAKAFELFQNQLKWRPIIGEFGTYKSAYFDMAKTSFELNQPEEALRFLDSSERYIWATKDKLKALALKSKCYLLLGNLNTSIAINNRFNFLRDSVELVKSNRQMIYSTAELETGLKEKEIITLKNKAEVEKKISQYQLISLILSLFILALVSFFYYRLNLRKKQLMVEKTLTEIALNEKQVLLKEVHHRVKNNLQVIAGMLQLQTTKISDKTAIKIFEESQNQIYSMSLVHQMLYQDDNVSKINIKKYLCDLLVHINNASNTIFRFEVTSEVEELELDQTIPIGLMVSELVQNSVKYAFNKSNTADFLVKIALVTYENKVLLTYSDNGPGFSSDVESAKKGMGLRLIEMLAEEINGKAKFDGKNGFSCAISFTQELSK